MKNTKKLLLYKSMKTLIVVAHPNKKSFSHKIAKVAQETIIQK
jgi:putative NADPH-quinone reductase